MLDSDLGDPVDFEVDLYRSLVTIPLYENGRRVLPCLFETPIIDLLDEEDEPLLDDDDPELAVFAVFATPGGERTTIAIDTEPAGRIIH